jgi:O-6-methylguanine DNA methyltransferase
MLNQPYEPNRSDGVLDDRAFPDAVDQLEAYFAGERSDFDLALYLAGSEFQRGVWRALLTIPYGETRSYGQIAEQIGASGAARAVGLANGHNPIAIVVPRHRAIGAGGASPDTVAGSIENAGCSIWWCRGRPRHHPFRLSVGPRVPAALTEAAPGL